MPDRNDSRLDYVPLNQIHYNPAINARRDTETDVTELAATIDTHNIGQPLLLRPGLMTGYEPIDGGRRVRALKLLVEQGKLPEDHPVPAYIRDLDDDEALSISLATVITRVDLHPADEALDFTDLAEKGQKPEDIAARFGIPVRRVRQRLAIGRLPGEIVEALKADEIDLKTAQAYTLLRDPRHALKLFNQGITDDWAIRSEFSKARVAEDSAVAAYVGRDAYVAAGGAIDEDLFSNNVWFADGKLLAKLFQQKLKDDEKAWLADGWSFVIIEMGDTYKQKTAGWSALQPEGKRSLSKEQKARADVLKAEIKSLRRDLQDASGDREREIEQRFDAAENELNELTAKFFTDAQKKKSGVTVRMGYNAIHLTFGVMKPADAKKEAKASKQKPRDPSQEPSAVRSIQPDAEADFTQALAVEMAKTMTHAMQRAIIAKPSEALRLAVAAIIMLGNFEKPEGFEIAAPVRRNADVSEDAASEHDQVVGPILRDYTTTFAGIFGAIEKHMALEELISRSLATLFKCSTSNIDELRPIIDAFDPDVISHWQPDVEFFKRMPRESLAAALGEAAIPGVTPSKKKKELVEMAARDLVLLGWLPKPLRTPSYKGPGSNAWADAHAAKTADEIVGRAQEEAV